MITPFGFFKLFMLQVIVGVALQVVFGVPLQVIVGVPLQVVFGVPLQVVKGPLRMCSVSLTNE
jgi:hypothetical protein